MRRVTSITSASLNSAGAWRSAVVEEDRHFGHVARRAACWCPRRSRRPWRRRACSCARSRPSPSAALRAGSTCRSRSGRRRRSGLLDHELGRLDEGLEAQQPQAADLHAQFLRNDAAGRWASSALGAQSSAHPAAGGGASPAISGSTISRISLIAEHLLDELPSTKKFGVPMIAELAPALLDPLQSVDHGLILAAGVKLRARHPHLRGDLEDGVEAHLLGHPGACCSQEFAVERRDTCRARRNAARWSPCRLSCRSGTRAG